MLISEMPKARCIKAVGVKGRMASMKSEAVSKRLTHCWARWSRAEREANRQKNRLTTRRQNKNMRVPPAATPSQLYKKPSKPPWAATLRATMATSGSGGKNDSTMASRMGATGPRPSKPASSSSQKSS